MWLDDSTLIAGRRMGTEDNRNPPAFWTDIPIHTFLIDHPDGYILFDTACSPKGMTERWPEFLKQLSPYDVPEEGILANRLAQLNVRPADIKYVVMSHLHVDHGGCLELFTNSEIIVSDNEFTKTMRQYVMNDDLGVHVPADIKAWINAGLKWRPVETDEKEIELLKGVTILNLGPGHSWGMLGLLVELENSGNIILASDAIYTRENQGPPIKLSSIVYDSLGYINTIKYLTTLGKKRNAQIWCGHDKEQFATLTKSTEGFYD